MAKKKKKKKGEQAQATAPVNAMPYYYQGPVPGAYPFPCAPASPIVQLPPIVQPIVMVPLTSQQQPVASYYEDEDDDFDF